MLSQVPSLLASHTGLPSNGSSNLAPYSCPASLALPLPFLFSGALRRKPGDENSFQGYHLWAV